MKHYMLWVFAYFLGSQWQILSFFLFQVSMRQTAADALFYLPPMWAWETLESYVIILEYPKVTHLTPIYITSPNDTCFGNGRNSESWNPKNTKLKVLVRFHWNFLSCVNITGTEILSSSFWPKFSKANKQKS